MSLMDKDAKTGKSSSKFYPIFEGQDKETIYASIERSPGDYTVDRADQSFRWTGDDGAERVLKCSKAIQNLVLALCETYDFEALVSLAEQGLAGQVNADDLRKWLD